MFGRRRKDESEFAESHPDGDSQTKPMKHYVHKDDQTGATWHNPKPKKDGKDKRGEDRRDDPARVPGPVGGGAG